MTIIKVSTFVPYEENKMLSIVKRIDALPNLNNGQSTIIGLKKLFTLLYYNSQII